MSSVTTVKQLYDCDHVVSFSVENTDVTHTMHGTTAYDTLTLPHTIQSIVQIVQTSDRGRSCIYDVPDSAWRYVAPNRILWILPLLQPNDTYRITYVYQVAQTRTYTAQSCPRCGGNAWFVGLMDSNGRMTTTTSGIDKLAEQYVHVLLCRKGTHYLLPRYGTDLLSLPGTVFGSTTELRNAVTVCVRDAETQLKAHIATEIEAGRTVPTTEQLQRVDILKVELDRDTMSGNVDLLLVAVNGETRRVTAGKRAGTPRRVG